MWRAIVIALVVAMAAVAVAACGEPEPEGPLTFAAEPEMTVEELRPYSVVITTSLGRMTFNLVPQEAPRAVNSFLFLAQEGYYDGMTVHRVVPGVLIETGDATGTGTGDAGYTFEIEPPQQPYRRGDLVMANTGAPNSNGSRFYIILNDLTDAELPPDYTIFGRVKENHAPSLTTLDKIGGVALGPGPDGEMSAPVQDVTIQTTKINFGCLPSMTIYSGC
ncbi:MAG: peptidylprolyl isomerase [Chloroflexi bacterium]|nr:peptidylprolyl isomerase [Chloroflexota bacterium]